MEVSATLDQDRATEGDEVELAVRLAAGTAVEQLKLWPRLHPNLEPVEGSSARVLWLGAGEEATVRFRLRCGRWGAYSLGEVTVRCHDRFGLLAFDHTLAAGLQW